MAQPATASDAPPPGSFTAFYITDMGNNHAPLLCRIVSGKGQCDSFCETYKTGHPHGHCDCSPAETNCIGPDGKKLPSE